MKFFYSSRTDGIDHINVYSKGKTELGRLLTNFAHTPFDCEDGHFESVEGYWYWLSTKVDHLRTLYGYEAKRFGSEMKRGIKYDVPDFNERIKQAIAIKILTNPMLTSMLMESTLPLVHYYEYPNKVVPLPKYQWIMDHISEIRKDLQLSNY